jgi:hypothetical protein
MRREHIKNKTNVGRGRDVRRDGVERGDGNSAKQNHQLCPFALLLLLTTASDEPQTNKQTNKQTTHPHPTTTIHAKPKPNKTKQNKTKQEKTNQVAYIYLLYLLYFT